MSDKPDIPFDLPEETILQFGEIDMAMDETLRSLDESINDGSLDLSDEDRTLVILHLRLAFVDGFNDCYTQVAKFDEIAKEIAEVSRQLRKR